MLMECVPGNDRNIRINPESHQERCRQLFRAGLSRESKAQPVVGFVRGRAICLEKDIPQKPQGLSSTGEQVSGRAAQPAVAIVFFSSCQSHHSYLILIGHALISVLSIFSWQSNHHLLTVQRSFLHQSAGVRRR